MYMEDKSEHFLILSPPNKEFRIKCSSSGSVARILMAEESNWQVSVVDNDDDDNIILLV